MSQFFIYLIEKLSLEILIKIKTIIYYIFMLLNNNHKNYYNTFIAKCKNKRVRNRHPKQYSSGK